MRPKRTNPIWPYLGILACLFLLSVTAPRAWERMARRARPMQVRTAQMTLSAPRQTTKLVATEKPRIIVAETSAPPPETTVPTSDPPRPAEPAPAPAVAVAPQLQPETQELPQSDDQPVSTESSDEAPAESREDVERKVVEASDSCLPQSLLTQLNALAG